MDRRVKPGDDESGQNPRPVRAAAPDLLRALRLPGVGLHDSRDRAAAVLVQQPVRRLPGVRRPRRRAAHRCRPDHPGQERDPARGRDRAVGEVDLALLHADAGGARQALPVHARHQVEGPAEEDAGRDPVRLGRHADPLRLRRRPALLRDQEAVRGRGQQPGAPLQGDRERVGARGDRQVLHRHSVPRLQRLPPQARGAVREDRRPAHRRSGRDVGQARGRMVHRRCRSISPRSRTRSPCACSRRSASG